MPPLSLIDKQEVDGWQIWKALARYNSSCWSSILKISNHSAQ
jgi:hypothetical protein